MSTVINLRPGMKIMARRKGMFWNAQSDWVAGIVQRIESEDGEEYVVGRWMKMDENDGSDPIFRVHRDDVRPYEVR
jgi:hypothetical protein